MPKIKITKLASLLLIILISSLCSLQGCASTDREMKVTETSQYKKVSRPLKKGRRAEKVKKEAVEYDIYKGDEDVIIYGASNKKGKSERLFTLFGSIKVTHNSGAETGYSISSGDINGDGIRDLIIGSPNTRAGEKDEDKAGRVYCLYGKKEMNDAMSVMDSEFILYNKPALSEKDWLGNALVAGDINGDGISDIIIGAPFNEEKKGAVFVVFGKKELSGENDIKKMTDISIHGANRGDMAGYSIALGDINGDGFADIIIGAPGSGGASGKSPGAGAVYIIFGGKNMEKEIHLESNYSVRIHGKEGGARGFFVFSEKSENKGGNVGYAVASGDVNGDGISDIIIGAPGADGDNRKDSGEVYVIYGNRELKGTIDLYENANIIISGAKEDAAGYSIVSSDINKDGRADMAIGAPNAGFKGGENRTGAVYIVYGKSITADSKGLPYKIDLDREADATIYGKVGQEDRGSILSPSGVVPQYLFGYSLSSGDFNGDGNTDIAIGAPGAYAMDSSRKKSAGEVYIVYGGEIKGEYVIENFADIVIYGADEKDMAGTSLFMDDLNGDGISDLIIGAPGAKGEMKDVVNTGEAYIFYGGKGQKTN